MTLPIDQRRINEGTTARYTATLTDEDGSTAIPSADLTTLTLTLYNEATGAIINSRSGTDILNASIGTVHATSGLLTLTLAPADTPIVDTTLEVGEFETHVALIELTWNSGAKAGKHEIVHEVRQMAKVPA